MDAEAIKYLTDESSRLLTGCRTRAHDGTPLYTPDGQGHYAALWTRDFAYMVENAGDLIPLAEVEAGVRYLVRGVRESDGAAPDRVQADGRAVYVAGPEQAPMGEPNLDNGPFLVLVADECVKRQPKERRATLWQEWLPALRRAMDYVPRSDRGLVWNDPAKPHSPYGFTDTVRKTGELFMESLLYWQACQRLAAAGAEGFAERADAIEQNVGVLCDEAAGAFVAATQDCRQLDVWANAFALYIDFPLGERRERVLRWLVDHRDQFLEHGQVRHLLRGEHWQRLFADIKPETYQNGAYWATASGWIIWVFAQHDRALARSVLDDLLGYFRTRGVFECVNGDYRQLEHYVVSATNPLGALRRLM